MTKDKYAIASKGAEKESIVSDFAAKAPFLSPIDQSGNLLKAQKNPFANTSGRVAPQAAEFLAETGVMALVAEKFGHKMDSEYDSKGSDHLESKGTVESAIRRLSREYSS